MSSAFTVVPRRRKGAVVGGGPEEERRLNEAGAPALRQCEEDMRMMLRGNLMHVPAFVANVVGYLSDGSPDMSDRVAFVCHVSERTQSILGLLYGMILDGDRDPSNATLTIGSSEPPPCPAVPSSSLPSPPEQAALGEAAPVKQAAPCPFREDEPHPIFAFVTGYCMRTSIGVGSAIGYATVQIKNRGRPRRGRMPSAAMAMKALLIAWSAASLAWTLWGADAGAWIRSFASLCTGTVLGRTATGRPDQPWIACSVSAVLLLSVILLAEA